MADNLPPNVQAQVVASLEGIETARNLALVGFTLYVWDYMITIDQEVEYFWAGPWSVSRILFLCNRYLTPTTLMVSLVCFYAPDLSTQFCAGAIRYVFLLNVIGLAIVQGILVLRIWYLFSHSRIVRAIAICTLASTNCITFVVLGETFKNLHPIDIQIPGYRMVGCAAPSPTGFWHMFLPNLLLHTMLYLFTAIRAMQNKQLFTQTPIMRRLLRDGGLFYLVVLSSVGYSGIGAFLTGTPTVNFPAVYSSFMLAVSTISISRLMLSIRSLASHLGSNEAWLLNNVELSRVPWRKGDREGEIVIEMDGVEGRDLETGPSRHSPPRLNIEVSTRSTLGSMLEGLIPSPRSPKWP